MSIHVGDIMKIYKDEEVPVDICILKSSKKNGMCFVDTVNLDGESNLKVKKCQHMTQQLAENQICSFNGIIQCETPNDLLDSWEGYLTMLVEYKEIIINFE